MEYVAHLPSQFWVLDSTKVFSFFGGDCNDEKPCLYLFVLKVIYRHLNIYSSFNQIPIWFIIISCLLLIQCSCCHSLVRKWHDITRAILPAVMFSPTKWYLGEGVTWCSTLDNCLNKEKSIVVTKIKLTPWKDQIPFFYWSKQNCLPLNL